MRKKLRGLGSVYKRGRIYWVAFYHNGQQVCKSAETDNETEANRFLQDQLEAANNGRLVTGSGSKLTIADLCRIVEDDYVTNEKRSLDRAQDGLAHLKEFFGADTRALDIEDAGSYVTQRKRTDQAANATIRYELALLRRAYHLARKRLGGHSPEIPSIAVHNARKGFFEERDFRALLANLDSEIQGAVEFAYLTGWRIRSEVFTLQWPQVDFEAGEIRLETDTTKNGEGRTFPIGVLPELRAILERQRAYTDAVQRKTGRIIPWVFHRNGARIKSIRGAWKAACKAAGLVNAEGKATRIPHDFRRTAVRGLERAGVPRSWAMQLMGHKTESIYRRYAIVAKQDLVDGLQRLATYRESLDKTPDNKVVSIESAR
jgi:integrase